MLGIRRRDFIAGLGGAAAWPLAARAQQRDRVRRIGVLMPYDENDPADEGRSGLAAFREELGKVGWMDGRNIEIHARWGAADIESMRRFAKELVGLQPDLILTSSTPAAGVMLQQTRTIPIIFVLVADPVGSGYVASLPHPGSNVTGFTPIVGTLGGKWVQLLKEATPRTVRAALIFARENVNDQFFGVIEAEAEALGVKALRTAYRDVAELQSAIDAFAAEPNGALIMVPPPPSPVNGELINRLAVMYRLPTMYSSKYYVANGGMMSFGAPIVDSYRIAASYLDRILRGAKISELPVQFPTKLELVINLKTAKAIGLTIPRRFFARADEVIE